MVHRVQRAHTSEQFHLGLITLLLKHADGLFGTHLETFDGNFLVNDLLHAFANARCIFISHPASDVQVDVIAVGNGNINHYSRPRIEVVNGLAQNEEQRSGVVS